MVVHKDNTIISFIFYTYLLIQPYIRKIKQILKYCIHDVNSEQLFTKEQAAIAARYIIRVLEDILVHLLCKRKAIHADMNNL